MLTGDNAILSKAGQAKEATRGSQVKEYVDLAAINNEGAEHAGGDKVTKDKAVSDLKEKGELTDKEVELLKDEDVITIGGITIDFSVLGPISNAKTLVQAFKDGEINVGDYITNYNSTLKNSSASVSVGAEKTGHTGTQQYQVDTNTTWRVLGLDETGTKLMITTGSPIKKVMKSTGEDWEKDPYLYLDKAEGWYWAGEATSGNILDEICSIYDSRFADKTKSMRIEDINTALGLTLDKANNKIYKTNDETKTAISAYQGFFGQSYTYKNGDYAPENYLKAKYPSNSTYSSMTNKKTNDSVAGTAFFYQYSSADIVDQSSKLYDVLFKGTELVGDGGPDSTVGGKAYWLASSGVYVDGSGCCIFGPGVVFGGNAGTGYDLFVSRGHSVAKWMAVRPVVYLQSGVTVDDLSVSSTGSEEEWTTTIPNSYTGTPLQYGQITE